MATGSKRAALPIIQYVPDGASLEDIMSELYVRQCIDRGLRGLAAERIVSHAG